MKAMVFSGPETTEIIDRPDPVPAAGEVLVAPTHVGLCGTDLEVFLGVMPYLHLGLASYPIQPGHEVAGVVVDAGDSGLPIGTRVLLDPVVGCGHCGVCASGAPDNHCPDRSEMGLRLGMHGGAADLIVVPARTAHVIPDGRLPSRSAVLAEPGVTALHSIRRTRPEPGCRALVVGADMVGCIAILPLLAEGAAVDVVETDPVRRALVEELGGQRVDPPTPDAYDVNALLLKDATLFGILNEPGLYDELLGIMARTPSAFDVLIDAEYPLSDGAAAMARLAGRGRTRPKVMLTVGT